MHEKSTLLGMPFLRFAFTFFSGLWFACPAFGQTTWTPRLSGVTSTLRQITFGEGVFLAVGNGGVLLRSTDGADWERVSSPTTDQLSGVCHGRGLFVAVGVGGRILYSSDGYLWFGTRVETAALNAVTFGNGRFIAAGRQGKLFVSDDGLTWAERATPSTVDLTDLTSYGGVIVVVGFLPPVLASTEGDLWSPQGISGFPSLTAVRHFRNEFIATVGSGANIYRSVNGLNWQATANGTGARLNALAKGVETLVAVGFDQTIFSSSNGVDWTERHRGGTTQLLGVAYGNGTFVAVGEGGAIFSSPETTSASSVVSLEVVDAIASEAGENSALVRLNRAGDLGQPATVVLPAGVGQTNLTITPFADEPTETREIVTLSIVSAEGASVNPLAETVTVLLTYAPEPTDSHLSAIGGTAERGVALQLNSVAGSEQPLYAGTNFLDWEAAFSVRNPFGQLLFTDPAAANFPVRYYRLQP